MSAMDYLTTKEVAEMFGASQTTISNQARRGDIVGAVRINSRMWLIPTDAIKTLRINYNKTPKKYIKKEG